MTEARGKDHLTVSQVWEAGAWRVPENPLNVPPKEDPVLRPSHYNQLPVECIDVAENFNYCMGNVLKYLWRADYKGKPIEDLRKAKWYLEREIARRERLQGN